MGVNVGKPDVLIKLDEENGKLTYGGAPVCDGHSSGGDTPVSVVSGKVAIVDSFADLDPNAEDGSLALARNADYAMAALEPDGYDSERDEYRIPNKLVSFAPQIEYRESVYTRALQNFMNSYPLAYRSYWSGATFDEGCRRKGVFRQNGDGTYTEITGDFHTGDSLSGYWYASRDREFYMETEIESTRKEFSIWGREYLWMCTVPVIQDAQDNVFTRERIECDGIMCDGIVAPNATTKYLIGAMWDGDTRQRPFLELFPGAVKVGGNIYRVPLIYLYAFEDMDGTFEYEEDDDSDKGYHMATVALHLQHGWNVVYALGALTYDPKDKAYEFEGVSLDSVEPVDGVPQFSIQTDETGTMEFHREIDALLFDGALVSKKEIHPAGLYIKTTNWLPINTDMLPRAQGTDYTSDIDALYERTDELENAQHEHSNKYVLDNLYESDGVLHYNGHRMRILQSVQFSGRYDNYDEYILYFADGSTDSMIIQHGPNSSAITGINFYASGMPYIDGCGVQYADGSEKHVSLTGLDLSVAFTNFREPMLHQTRQFGDTRMYLKLGGSNPTEGGYSQYVDLHDGDRDTAKLDYLDMMLGTGFETQLLYERVQRNYNAGFWTIEHLRKAVEHNWINETDYENLTGEPYALDEEDNTDDQG